MPAAGIHTGLAVHDQEDQETELVREELTELGLVAVVVQSVSSV